MSKFYRERFTVEYSDDIRQDERGRSVIGKKRMKCEIEVYIDLTEVARVMGSKACASKGGFCVDGYTTVKRVGQAVELSREMKPLI